VPQGSGNEPAGEDIIGRDRYRGSTAQVAMFAALRCVARIAGRLLVSGLCRRATMADDRKRIAGGRRKRREAEDDTV
jgi:hypothetical protein